MTIGKVEAKRKASRLELRGGDLRGSPLPGSSLRTTPASPPQARDGIIFIYQSSCSLGGHVAMQRSRFLVLIGIALLMAIVNLFFVGSVGATECPSGHHAVWRPKTPEELIENPGDLFTWDCFPNETPTAPPTATQPVTATPVPLTTEAPSETPVWTETPATQTATPPTEKPKKTATPEDDESWGGGAICTSKNHDLPPGGYVGFWQDTNEQFRGSIFVSQYGILHVVTSPGERSQGWLKIQRQDGSFLEVYIEQDQVYHRDGNDGCYTIQSTVTPTPVPPVLPENGEQIHYRIDCDKLVVTYENVTPTAVEIDGKPMNNYEVTGNTLTINNLLGVHSFEISFDQTHTSGEGGPVLRINDATFVECAEPFFSLFTAQRVAIQLPIEGVIVSRFI
ncbi:TPA: hypothetical protein DIV55_00490 [Patescibacteria group bacterium]|nr:hypothetical protein [Patescibacteria group bacterium]